MSWRRQFTDRARTVAEHFGKKVDEVFGPESGRLAKDLEKHFGDGSSASVQNRVRELVGEALTRSRQDLVRQFSAADGSNPLADFKAGALDSINQAASRSDATQRALLAKLAELQKELQSLRDEKDKLEEVHAERERGTAKGRSFEELVADSVDALALPQGDVAEAVGDQRGAAGKTGDVVVAVGACDGPARGRIVFEAKDRRLSKPAALAELDRALSDRDADFAVLVVPSEDELPARLQPLREYNGDKLLVVLDPDEDSGLVTRDRLPPGACPGAHGPRRRGRGRRGRARPGGAGHRLDGRRAQGEEPAHRRQDRHRHGVQDRGGDRRARARAPGRGGRAGAGRGAG